ncbi:hypothetical protein C2G38_2228252 [Gigaspora rosea]|uniref:MACPF domain-containing protein n=1 Tax=Gigaspora rosea TaxID=44941 RepID=A0A397U5G8_9GLOM|nr:hypothetical protein C2G38_2228252 [Gigaspora rosea]
MELIISNIKATDEFIRAIRDALSNHDKIGKLREIIKDYSYFYARHFTLGGLIERTEKNIENSDTKTSVTGEIKIPNLGINSINAELNVHDKKNTHSSSVTNKEVTENIIGGTFYSYSQDDKKP